MLSLEEIVQVLDGVGPPCRVQIVHPQGGPHLHAPSMAGLDDEVTHLLVGAEARPEHLFGDVVGRIRAVADVEDVGVHLSVECQIGAGLEKRGVVGDVGDQLRVGDLPPLVDIAPGLL